VKDVTNLTNGVGAYTNFDLDNIIARGSFFILRMKLHSNVGLPHLEARCGFQRRREARGQVGLWLESEPEGRPSRIKEAFRYVIIESFSGDLISASLRVELSTFTIALRCKRSWDEEPRSHGVLESEHRVHLHVHILARPMSSIEPSMHLIAPGHLTFFPSLK
jgi:hypothetical protein